MRLYPDRRGRCEQDFSFAPPCNPNGSVCVSSALCERTRSSPPTPRTAPVGRGNALAGAFDLWRSPRLGLMSAREFDVAERDSPLDRSAIRSHPDFHRLERIIVNKIKGCVENALGLWNHCRVRKQPTAIHFNRERRPQSAG